jgi:hypothetical protein
MRAYLVRLKKNAELVGLFVSPSVSELWNYVDECCPPDATEFLRLPPGGIYLPKAGAARIPTIIPDPDDDESYPDWFSGAVLSDLWLDIFYDEPGYRKWKPVEPPEDEIVLP